MTIKELYNWAVERGVEDDELTIKADGEGLYHLTTKNISPSFRTYNTTFNFTEEYTKEFPDED